MRRLIFLSKVAFLSGLVMLLAFLLLHLEQMPAGQSGNKSGSITSLIVLTGYGLSVIMIPLINIVYFILWISGKKPGGVVPKWLLISNIVFLLLLFFFIFYFNDPFYHKR